MRTENTSSHIYDVSDEQVDKLAVILKQEGHDYTHDQVKEIADSLLTFYSVLGDGYEEFAADEERLKTEPDGWKVKNSSDWSCRVCGRHEDELWHEAEGFRCNKCKQKDNTRSSK